jgi:hypothetical protein
MGLTAGPPFKTVYAKSLSPVRLADTLPPANPSARENTVTAAA